jgi:hypothetical protein
VVKQLTLTVFETEGCCGKHEAGISARHRPLGIRGWSRACFASFYCLRIALDFDKVIVRLYLKA